jgi:phage terminase large subunit-like protein
MLKTAHPDWKNAKIKFFSLAQNGRQELERKNLTDLTKKGILTLSAHSIEIIKEEENHDSLSIINEHSKDAGLTIIGFDEDGLKFDKNIINRLNISGDLLFVHAKGLKENI